MSRHSFLFRKGGIPALASCLSDTAVLCAGNLVVRVDESSKRATIVLEFEVPVRGSATDQRMSLVYDGNNLAPGVILVSPERLEQIEQNEYISRYPTECRPCSMRLILVKPCVVLCSLGRVSPKHGYDSRFNQVATLARATKLDIVFDSSWIHPDKDTQFHYLTANAGLTGFARNNAKTVGDHDWTVFDTDEAALPDEPPPYNYTSLKRSRQGKLLHAHLFLILTSIGSPGSPETSPKRLLLDAAPGTPTEKATTVAASPSPPFAPSSPPAPSFDHLQMVVQNAVENAIAKTLPNAIHQLLPHALEKTLACMVNSPAAATLAQTTQGSPRPMSPLHTMIRRYLDVQLDELWGHITLETEEHTEDVRHAAEAELEERLDDHRVQITELQAEGVANIQQACATELEVLKEQTLEMREDLEHDTAEAFTMAKKKIGKFVRKQKLEISKERLMVLKQQLHSGNPTADPIQRASSVPLDIGW
jgi:hypothetical protein